MIDVLTRLRGSSAESGKLDVITRLRGRGGSSRDVVTRLRGSSVSAFTVGFAPPLLTQFNPFDRIPLTVAPSLPADAVVVTQTAGASAVLTGSGLDWSARAPGTVAGSTITFRVAASLAGFPDAVGTYTVTVLSHAGFFDRAGVALELMPDA